MNTESYTSGPTVMMTLGRYQFGLATAAYQEFSRVTAYRWPSQDRFMQGQALQFVGVGEDTITLPGVIFPEFRGGIGQVEAMRAEAGQGLPLTMINGQGMVMGRWVIERIEERGSVFGAAGVARKQEFSLALRKFDDEGAGADTRSDSDVIASATGQAGFGAFGGGSGAAIDGGQGITAMQGAQALPASVEGKAGGFAASLMDSVNAVTAVAADIGDTVNTILTPVRRAMDVANGLKNAAKDSKRLLGAIPTNLSAATSLERMLNAATSAVTNAGQAGTQVKRSLADLTALGTVPQQALNTVQSAMVSVNRLTVYATQVQENTSKLLDNLTAEA